jgi:hypothetical protein
VLGQLATAGGGVGGFPFFFCKRDIDLAVVVGLVDAGTGCEVGQLAEVDVELYGAAFDGNALDAGAPGWVGMPRRAGGGSGGVGVGDDGAGGDALTGF